MPRGMFKSRTLRNVPTKTPGGRIVKKFVQRKPKKAHCAMCKGDLHGIPRATPTQMAKLSKSEKRPERTYGGVLCGNCVRVILKQEARE